MATTVWKKQANKVPPHWQAAYDKAAREAQAEADRQRKEAEKVLQAAMAKGQAALEKSLLQARKSEHKAKKAAEAAMAQYGLQLDGTDSFATPDEDTDGFANSDDTTANGVGSILAPAATDVDVGLCAAVIEIASHEIDEASATCAYEQLDSRLDGIPQYEFNFRSQTLEDADLWGIEFVMWLGLRANEKLGRNPARVYDALRKNPAKAMKQYLGLFDSRPLAPGQSPGPGDVVFFYGTTHVAYSMYSGEVVSLWVGPDGSNPLQTTVGAINEMILDPAEDLEADCYVTGTRDFSGRGIPEGTELSQKLLRGGYPAKVRRKELEAHLKKHGVVANRTPGLCISVARDPFARWGL